MEEAGDRATVFEFGGLRDRQRDYLNWVLKASLSEGVAPEDVVAPEATTLMAARLEAFAVSNAHDAGSIVHGDVGDLQGGDFADPETSLEHELH